MLNLLMLSFKMEGNTMKKLKLTLVAVLMLGVIAAQAEARDPGNNVRHARVFDPPQAEVFLPPPPSPSLVFTYQPHFRDRYDHRPHYRPHYRSSERCRDIVTVERRHGRYREVIRTVCRERDRWRDGRRDHWRGDHQDHWREDHRRRW